ncbi:hypothetical protein MHA02_35640 [Methylobacterium haplocladii]|uniref:Uncharacterized protein n=1 Tax=Methylobacterium haplocladii TaxID=1176176 RepID=A0A512ITZ4_9HYPH|nr:hypothetical protein MHA02_35640 [Methylobacterium haplocladii]
MDVLQVLGRGGLVLDDLAHGVAPALIPRHALTPGFLGVLCGSLRVTVALPEQQMLDDLREQEPAPRCFQLGAQVRVTDLIDLLVEP